MTETRLVDELNATYARLHTAKEDAFWTAYMGLAEDVPAARADLDTKEIALQRWLRDPERLPAVRARLAEAEDQSGTDADEIVALRGWENTFEANGIEGEESRALAEEIVAAESELAKKRGAMQLGYVDPQAGFTPASSVKLGTMLMNDPDPALRQAAWEGLRSIETCALEGGFLEVVKMRNRLARLQGAEDYYDWKVRRSERMSKQQVFELLDDLERRTRKRAQASIDELRTGKGAQALLPWNARFMMSGDVSREQDPYFPFSKAIEVWGKSFGALGIKYRSAKLVLDLLDRKGKYENGFMHGPEVAWRDRDQEIPARIHFTANAIPGMTGSGLRALQTLFHEGGHAAHFANIRMPAPCFGQENAPTSVAFAETQSMFLDSLIDDADWRLRYARNAEGQAMPWELIEKGLRAKQPFAAWDTRQMLSVCYGERAIYELSDEELSAERVLEELRHAERRMLFLEQGSPRPVLSIPHLLAGESSAYYHGYVLAEMGVHQTRAFFLERDGHLVDNPKIGPALLAAYWQPGNSRSMQDMILDLTGKPFSAEHLAAHVGRTADEAVAQAERSVERLEQVPSPQEGVELEAQLSIVHGHEIVSKLEDGRFDAFAAEFGAWIDGQLVS